MGSRDLIFFYALYRGKSILDNGRSWFTLYEQVKEKIVVCLLRNITVWVSLKIEIAIK